MFEKKFSKNCEIFFPKNIFFEIFLYAKKIFFKKICKKKFSKKNLRKGFLPTLVEVSSSGLKLKENEIFLQQWVEIS